ncbi:MAG TPA: hypothetical protein VEX57_16600 [Microlunatus sp.]|nr:hypothetical protein [Microlunatus sp.]
MSGVLHPMGPEPAQTYWVRRGVLLAVVLLLAVLVVFGVANLTKAAVATSPPPPIPPAATSPTPSTSASPSAAASTPAATPTPSVAPSGSPSVSASTPTTTGPSSPTAKPTVAPTAKPTVAPTAKSTPTVIGTPDCRPAGLRVTLKGDRGLSPGQNNTFTLSLINAGTQTCLASVTDGNFELKIFSGKDRIWSSQDCAKTLAAFDKKLAARADVSWKMTWNGERSVKGKECKRGPDTPLAGTYWATAQLDGAKPVQLRMIIS